MSTLIYFFICTRPFDQKLGSSLIYFFYLHTTIRPNYRVLFHLFFLQCTTIRPKIRVFIDIFLSFAHDHSTKYMIFFLSFILSLCTIIRPKNRVIINLLFLFVYDHLTKFGVTLTLKFILFLDVSIFRLLYSCQVLPLYFHRSVSGSTVFIFRPLCSQYYYLYLSYTIFIGELLLYFVRYIHGYMKSWLCFYNNHLGKNIAEGIISYQSIYSVDNF